MTPKEISDLLKEIAARDRRTIGATDIAVWLKDIGDLNFNEASDAVAEHFREEPDKWLMAGHVYKRVKARRAKLLDKAGTFPATKALIANPPVTEEDYRRAVNRVLARIGDNQAPPLRALTAGQAATGGRPNEEFRNGRDALGVRPDRRTVPDPDAPTTEVADDPQSAAVLEAERERQLAALQALIDQEAQNP